MMPSQLPNSLCQPPASLITRTAHLSQRRTSTSLLFDLGRLALLCLALLTAMLLAPGPAQAEGNQALNKLGFGSSSSSPASNPGSATATALLPAAQAFALDAAVDADGKLVLHYTLAPGYYLYRDKLGGTWQGGPAVAAPALPAGTTVFDPTFGQDMEVYRDQLAFAIPLPEQASDTLVLLADSQGCAEDRLCYPPLRHHVNLHQADGSWQVDSVQASDDAVDTDTAWSLQATSLESSSTPQALAQTSASVTPAPSADSQAQPRASSMTELLSNDRGMAGFLADSGTWRRLATFFGLGLLLSLTPCVLPMLPILSAMLTATPAGQVSRWRGLTLAAAYVAGMSLIYTAMGLLAGASGAALSSWLQMPWMIGLFAVALVLLALAQFGAFTFQMPNAVQSRLGNIGRGGIANSLPRAALLGGVSALVIGPCVAAPLAGTLLYLSQTGDVGGAGLALFVLAWGMGMPLLLLGAAAGRWRPRPGPWMEGVRQFTGLLLLGTAWWLASPLLPAWLMLLGWALLAAFAAVLWGAFEKLPRPIRASQAALKAVALLCAALAVIWLIGAASGARDPFAPLAHWRSGAADDTPQTSFRTIDSASELDTALAASTRPVMLDVYADWCVVCHQMERDTLSNPAVAQRLQDYTLLRLDVTRATAEDRQLLRQLELFGPPAILFFDAGGKPREDARIIGYMAPPAFLNVLQRVAAQ